MSVDQKELENLFMIYEQAENPAEFYFKHIFLKAVEKLASNTNPRLTKMIQSGKYEALLVPVGFSIENVALISAFFKPKYLAFVSTEKAATYQRDNIELLINNLKILRDDNNIECQHIEITSNDQEYMAKAVSDWVKEMNSEPISLQNAKIALDLTGGTKPMSIGAQNAALSLEDIDAYYLKVKYNESTGKYIPGTEKLIHLIKSQPADDNLIFVVMDFEDKFDEVYTWIKETIQAPMQCVRSDKEIYLGDIMEQVRKNIKNSCLIIAELTDNNPNVFYELGLAHAWKKKVILLRQHVDNIPFDTRNLRVIPYDMNNKGEFQKLLRDAINYCKNLTI